MHTLRLILNTTKYDEYMIDKRFHALSHIHNVMVKRARKLLVRLKYDKEYQLYLSEYKELCKKYDKCEELSEAEDYRKKELSKLMSDIRLKMQLSEKDFQKYLKVCGKQYKKCLSSLQVQKEATRVWRGVEKVLFADGEELHFKKFMDFNTIGGKNNTNGVKFNKSTLSIEWIGLNIKCKHTKNYFNTDYVSKALSSDISYCEIERKMFPNGWHYYVIVYFKDDAPHKLNKVGGNLMGIDPGTSSMAGYSSSKAVLTELAPECEKYNRQIKKLSRKLDNSKKIANPSKYNPDGTIKKGNCDKWIFSNTYLKNSRKLKYLYRKKAAYTKQSHEELCNKLLSDSNIFILEAMNYKGLQRKSKKTERSDELSAVKQKDGTVKHICKYKRKKRFGKSLNNRAPAMFLTILERKAKLYGGQVFKIDTQTFKASQYNHITDTYTKIPLSQRNKDIASHKVQRDLYSAYLICNADEKLEHPDRDKCIYGFNRFLELQNELIGEMIQNNISMKQCFGF